MVFLTSVYMTFCYAAHYERLILMVFAVHFHSKKFIDFYQTKSYFNRRVHKLKN